MASDYDRIRHENVKRYGTDIAGIGKMLFTDTYAYRRRDFVLAAGIEKLDHVVGCCYVHIPVRLGNICPERSSAPTTMDQKIRYRIPRWKSLCELLKT